MVTAQVDFGRRDFTALGDFLPRRDLTSAEAGILKLIQEGYGLHNTVDDVFFTDSNEAAILVKAPNGPSALMANLTTLAVWRADGTIPSDEELKTHWLRLR